MKIADNKLIQLLAMEQGAVDADLGRYKGRVSELVGEIQSLLRLPREQKTRTVETRVGHLTMIQAHEFHRDEAIPKEVKTFYTAFGAERIAQEAEVAAFEKGTVSQLSARMEEIRVREGLVGDEYWMTGDGPDDYRQLVDQQEALLDRIHETVFIFFLRRYRLEEYADLYERNRLAFEIQREVGRRLIHELGVSAEWQRLLGNCFRARFGAAALGRVVARVEAIRTAGWDVFIESKSTCTRRLPGSEVAGAYLKRSVDA